MSGIDRNVVYDRSARSLHSKKRGTPANYPLISAADPPTHAMFLL